MSYSLEKEIAVQAVLKACKLCQSVRRSMISDDAMLKEDKSPVTIADFGSQAVIIDELYKHFPKDPFIAEEDAAELLSLENTPLRESVYRQVQQVSPSLKEDEIVNAIQRGNYIGQGVGRQWVLDPIDGTKGYLRNGQYAVALALIENGKIVLGILGCPNLGNDFTDPESSVGCLYLAVRGEGVVSRSLEAPGELSVKVSEIDNPSETKVCESRDSGHSSHGKAAQISDRLGITATPIRIDSQCKYAVVARGDASIYLRLPASRGYEEKIWDHAAGVIIIEEAGGRVSDVEGRPLDFTRGNTLKGNRGVIATSAPIYDDVIAVVREIMSA
jgi:3'(2'), 5'-bisphosphate nucleotidase